MFSTGPKLKFKWLTPSLVVVTFLAGTLLKFMVPLSVSRYVVTMLNLIGTVLLASAFEPQIPQHGNGGLWDSLKWAVREFPNYGSPPAFDFLRFYVGLLLVILGILASALIKA